MANFVHKFLTFLEQPQRKFDLEWAGKAVEKLSKWHLVNTLGQYTVIKSRIAPHILSPLYFLYLFLVHHKTWLIRGWPSRIGPCFTSRILVFFTFVISECLQIILLELHLIRIDHESPKAYKCNEYCTLNYSNASFYYKSRTYGKSS